MSTPEPARSRAVLSTEDFKLIRKALEHYLPTIEDGEESKKFARLYHRLGTAAKL
ncbi:hypothetical protein [Sphingorhabdus sp.]|jgi:hypothetical protein|uniref:hypothetical protein n=1 Tax=Sphingorhabdus sp. TaxID=1902408 RepID=UPI003BB03C98|nr:hypothetical protein [Sphingomonadales bacterium]MBK9431926.1 hypothetical protein [Sphingomonadales bacterium]MBL0022355.1 hypothetical protein [Sphingomonadales bacterium]